MFNVYIQPYGMTDLASVALRDIYSKSTPNYIASDVSLAPQNSHINRQNAIALDPCIFAKGLG